MQWFKKYYGKDLMSKIALYGLIPGITFLFVLAGLTWWIGILIYLAFVLLFYIKRKTL